VSKRFRNITDILSSEKNQTFCGKKTNDKVNPPQRIFILVHTKMRPAGWNCGSGRSRI